MTDYHKPVMAGEMVQLLDPQPGETFVDATAGGGGHSAIIAERLAPGGKLILIDQDPAALAEISKTLQRLSPQITALHGNFRDLKNLLDSIGVGRVNSILFDLGVSSHQLDSGERGFSFRADAPLDLRMDPTQGVPASDMLVRLSEHELSQALWENGERWAARIARFIKSSKKRIATTFDLVDVVKAAIPKAKWPKDIHPATRTFQSLRILTNDEIGALREGLEAGIDRLADAGRIAVISYHSLEDRLVKQTFLRYAGRCQCPPGIPICRCGATRVLEIITRRAVTPEKEEIDGNPRARSAKLRGARRVI